MLSLDRSLKLSSFAIDFWQLPVSKEFTQPEYYIGQTVLHIIKRPNGEILHPVVVIGLSWTEIDWQYSVSLPPDHPQFKEEYNEREWLDDYQIEAM